TQSKFRERIAQLPHWIELGMKLAHVSKHIVVEHQSAIRVARPNYPIRCQVAFESVVAESSPFENPKLSVNARDQFLLEFSPTFTQSLTQFDVNRYAGVFHRGDACHVTTAQL